MHLMRWLVGSSFVAKINKIITKFLWHHTRPLSVIPFNRSNPRINTNSKDFDDYAVSSITGDYDSMWLRPLYILYYEVIAGVTWQIWTIQSTPDRVYIIYGPIDSHNTKRWWRTVFFKTRGHLSRLAWPTQRDGLSCLASPRLALRCAAWPSKTNPEPCSRSVATSGCSHRYYNSIVHNAKCINITFFSVRQALLLYKNDCLKW